MLCCLVFLSLRVYNVYIHVHVQCVGTSDWTCLTCQHYVYMYMYMYMLPYLSRKDTCTQVRQYYLYVQSTDTQIVAEHYRTLCYACMYMYVLHVHVH